MKIRRATESDLSAINDIYNEAILKTVATFDTEIKTLEDRQSWFSKHGSRYPVLVAEDESGTLGWASLSPYSDRAAYADTVELSIYLWEKTRGKGTGKALMKALLDEGRKAGIHAVLARITQGNDVSIRLHEAFGFFRVGTMKEVGKKFGRILDVDLLQAIL